jgi:hypothetical protein
MELDRKSFLLAAASFVAGFLFCCVFLSGYELSPSPPPPRTSPIVATGPVMASTQFQPRIIHIVLPPSRSSIQQDIPGDSLPVLEIMKQPSLHLIDTRAQPQMDLKDLGQ